MRLRHIGTLAEMLAARFHEQYATAFEMRGIVDELGGYRRQIRWFSGVCRIWRKFAALNAVNGRQDRRRMRRRFFWRLPFLAEVVKYGMLGDAALLPRATMPLILPRAILL